MQSYSRERDERGGKPMKPYLNVRVETKKNEFLDAQFFQTRPDQNDREKDRRVSKGRVMKKTKCICS